MSNANRTIEDMNLLNLNKVTAKEFASFTDASRNALACMEQHIETLRYSNGRKIRKERRKSMIKVLKVLYFYLKTDDIKAVNFGECSPSMRTMAYYIDSTLEAIKETDSELEIKRKNKSLNKVLMVVQRSIEVLREFGIIIAHTYRAETNRNDDPSNPNRKMPNFFYELVPVSSFSIGFKELLNKASRAMSKLSMVINNVKNKVLDFERVMQFNNPLDFVSKEYLLRDTTIERRLKSTGLYTNILLY